MVGNGHSTGVRTTLVNLNATGTVNGDVHTYTRGNVGLKGDLTFNAISGEDDGVVYVGGTVSGSSENLNAEGFAKVSVTADSSAKVTARSVNVKERAKVVVNGTLAAEKLTVEGAAAKIIVGTNGTLQTGLPQVLTTSNTLIAEKVEDLSKGNLSATLKTGISGEGGNATIALTDKGYYTAATLLSLIHI